MTVNTTLAGLSQNPTLNGPDGASDPPSSIDDALRYSLSFTAQLRDGVGFTAGAVVAGLGFTPVQQGGGTSMTADKVYIGWDAVSGAKFRIQVNTTSFGTTWPIDIGGNAATATSATSATNATNATNATTASQLTGGYVPTSFMIRGTSNNFTCIWTGARIVFGVDGNTFGNVMPMDISGNAATATTSASCSGNAASSSSCSGNAATCTTATNSNALGGIPASGFVQAGGSVISLTNSGFTQMTANVGGSTCFWGMTLSDGRLKEAVLPAARDSLADICAINFKQYRFKRLPGQIQIDDGHLHEVGLILQDAEKINPEWSIKVAGGVGGFDDTRQPVEYAMLMSAMHAIQQLSAEVAALQAKLAGVAP